MKIKLRADQLMLVESVLQNIKEDNLVVSPSGSGKSYMLAYLEKLLSEQGYLVYVYAPTIEVREQLDELMKANGSNNKTKGIVEDFNNNNDAPDYLLIDEAHHSEADTYQLLFEKYRLFQKKRILFQKRRTILISSAKLLENWLCLKFVNYN